MTPKGRGEITLEMTMGMGVAHVRKDFSGLKKAYEGVKFTSFTMKPGKKISANPRLADVDTVTCTDLSEVVQMVCTEMAKP